MADDQLIEDVGVSPQLFVPAEAGDFMRGRDPVLAWALSASRSQTIGAGL